MISYKNAAKKIWDLSLWESEGEKMDCELQEALLLAIWALVEQARYQDETSI